MKRISSRLPTPDGRRAGSYMSHGPTPSRLHRIDSVTDVFAELRYFDFSKVGANSIINVVLPLLNSFLRGCAAAKVQALQVNCVSREELLAAQRKPDKHRDIIVRVCGFSAPFVSLSSEWQQEFLTRNFYR